MRGIGLVVCSALALLALVACVEGVTVTKIHGGLVSEGIEYNPRTGKLLVGSISKGAIYEVESNGDLNVFADDDVLTSTTGIQVDTDRDFLYACNNEKAFPDVNNHAGLAILSLRDGALVRYVDLTNLLGSDAKLLNDVTLADSEGFIYATDSLGGAIFQIDPETGDSALYFQSDDLKPNDSAGVGANGIEIWRDRDDKSSEFLIIAKSGASTETAALYRLDLGLELSERALKKITLNVEGFGYDGLFMVRSGERTGTLYAVSSDTVYSYVSSNFETALQGDIYDLVSLQGTTAVYIPKGDKLAVNCANNFSSETTFIDTFVLEDDALVNSASSFGPFSVLAVLLVSFFLLFV